MGSYSSGNTSITGSVAATVNTNIATPSATQTLIALRVATTGGLQTAYTPTAGKTFYLYSFSLDDAAMNCSVYAADGSTVITSPTAPAASSYLVNPGIPICSYDDSHPVKVSGTNAKHITIYGIEQ